MNADQAAARQADRDNLVGELVEALSAIVRSAELNQAAINNFLLIDARAALEKAKGKS